MTQTASPDRIPADPQVRAAYSARSERHAAARDEAERLSRRLSWARLAAVLAGLFGIVAGLWELDQVKIELVAAGIAAFAVFVGLAAWHEGVIRTRDRHAALLAINEDGLQRLDRDWERLAAGPAAGGRESLRWTDGFMAIPAGAREPAPGPARGAGAAAAQKIVPVPGGATGEESSAHVAATGAHQRALAVDLDLLDDGGGGASLERLLAPVHTPAGRRMLRDWLLHPAAPQEIGARQEAVEALAPGVDFRQELDRAGRLIDDAAHDPAPFVVWAEEPPWLLTRRWLSWTARALAAATLVLVALHIAGVLPPLWPIMLAVNLLFSAAAGGRARETFSRLDWRSRTFGVYGAMLGHAVRAGPGGARLEALTGAMSAGGLSAHRQLARLERINGFAEIRLSALAHLPLQALLLWDFHVIEALERWRRTAGARVGSWLEALGELEVLAAIAGLRHDHPGWAFPELTTQGPARVEAEALGHPLLHPDRCVTNDVEVGPPGTFLLVTGSNMSGKSTLLRAVGVNLVLAQAGGPVCARRMKFTPVVLGTSFRVRDSLASGVSFFMAELRRLAEVVAQAQDARRNGGRSLLFLLDEILQGTNVFERQVAVRRVIRHLLDQEAVGVVSTHDLSLADAEGLSEGARPVHFTETYREEEGETRMEFDYRLRDGVAPTTNALKLLEMVGLGGGQPPLTWRFAPSSPLRGEGASSTSVENKTPSPAGGRGRG